MSAPRATGQQLAAIVERELRRRDGDLDDRRFVMLVHADPTERPDLGTVAGRAVAVHGSSSPLEIRALLCSQLEQPVVVLTDAEPASLGDDLLARCVGRRLVRPDRWGVVCQMFGAERPSSVLAHRPHLVDALIEARPFGGYPQVTTRILDLDTATAALVREYLGISDDVTDLADFLEWASRPAALGRFAASPGLLLDDLRATLRDRFGEGADAVVAAMALDRPDDLVPLGLVAGILHDPACQDLAAQVRLDERLGRQGLGPDAYRRWGRAAEARAQAVDDGPVAGGWYRRAEELLADLDGAGNAVLSDHLPSGHDERIRRAAEALTAWRDAIDNRALAQAAHDSVRHVARHDGARTAPDRRERLEMAARLIRRGSFALPDVANLGEAARAYARDGAWLDAARLVVSRGDPDPVLAALCLAVTVDADHARMLDGPAFARLAAQAAHPLTDQLIGVEDIIDRVVAPLAASRPVVFVVLDGLSWPTFCDVVGELESAGWAQWQRHDDATGGPVALAALPTVTEVSRTSLFAGELRRGDDGSEVRAFAAHPALARASHHDLPPVVFHKRELRAGGLDTLPVDLVDRVADPRQRVVGVVINNIDERLKDVAQPPGGWKLGELDPLRYILDSARETGRAVVLTADHGHVLDRDAEGRTTAGGGERWRTTPPGAGAGEVEVRGPRVVADGQVAILPWQEQVRYGPRRNGYHGGMTPQELFVPLVVLSTEDVDGWTLTGTVRPPWWHHQAAQIPVVAPSRRPTVAAPAAPTLFDLGAGTAPDPTEVGRGSAEVAQPIGTDDGSDWIDQLLGNDVVARRRRHPRHRLGDDEVRRLLTVLDAWSGMAIDERRLAEEAALPPARIGRYVAQLQDLLNIDGYPVVTAVDGDVHFDRDLLDRQMAT
jgi:hypothetical protein